LTIVGDPLEQAVLKKSGYRLVAANLVAPIVAGNTSTGNTEQQPKPMTIASICLFVQTQTHDRVGN
jgi:hypothetical protein